MTTDTRAGADALERAMKSLRTECALYTRFPSPRAAMVMPMDEAAAVLAELRRLQDALREIALAGMTLPRVCGEDEKRSFHAQQAWSFKGIAARALTAQEPPK